MPTRKIRDLDPQQTCRDPDHDPPKHMVYPVGVYEHTCPTCGKVTVFTVTRPLWRHGWMNSLHSKIQRRHE